MSRILITGVDGFTGRYLTILLSRHGHEVVGISHMPITSPIEGLSRSVICDLTDAKALTDTIADIRPDKVVHLAAIAFVSHGVAEDIYRTNIVGSRNLLDALDKAGNVDTILLASSANIYGNRVSGAITEAVSPDPVNDYAVSKLSMEFVARLYRERLPIILARPFNYTGVGQSINFVIPKIVHYVLQKADEIELGNLDVSRDFSDVRDVVSAYASLLDAPSALGETFNICSGKAYSLREVIAMIQEISGRDFAVRVNPDFVRENEVKTLWGDRSKLDAVSGQRPIYDLRDTLTWMLNHQ